MGTAENQEKTIATTGSPHVAKSGPPDVCFLPGKKGVVAPPNEVPSTRATEHTSPKTVISGEFIVQKGDAIGPPSDPAHPGTDGGVKSGTYRKEARATSGSPNVKTEGNQPARHVDPTTQNHGNTTGSLVDTSLAPKADAGARKPEERCTVTELVLACSHGRTTTPKDPTLDVLSKDTVTATSTRRDLLKPGEPLAVCPPIFPGRHPKTKFTVKRAGPKPKDPKGPETKDGVDVFELAPGVWIGDEKVEGITAKDLTPKVDQKAGGLRTSSHEKDAAWTGGKVGEIKTSGHVGGTEYSPKPKLADYDPAKRESYGYQDPQGYSGNSADRRRQRRADERAGLPDRDQVRRDARDTFDKNAAEADSRMRDQKALATVKELGTSLLALRDLYMAEPQVITVEGQGCAGSQTRTLRVYPEGEKSFDLMKMKEVLSAWDCFKKAFQIAAELCNKLGIGNFLFKIMDPISCEFKLSWQELERDSTAKDRANLTIQRVNREWSLDFTGTLIDFKVEARIPVAVLVGAAGAARLANWIRDRFAVGADVVVAVKLGLTITVGVGKNRYDELALLKAEFKPSIDVSIGVSLQAARAGVTITVGAKISPRIQFKLDAVKYLIISLLADKASLYLKATLQYDVLGWKDEISGEWTLHEFPYGEQKTDVAAWLGR